MFIFAKKSKNHEWEFEGTFDSTAEIAKYFETTVRVVKHIVEDNYEKIPSRFSTVAIHQELSSSEYLEDLNALKSEDVAS